MPMHPNEKRTLLIWRIVLILFLVLLLIAAFIWAPHIFAAAEFWWARLEQG